MGHLRITRPWPGSILLKAPTDIDAYAVTPSAIRDRGSAFARATEVPFPPLGPRHSGRDEREVQATRGRPARTRSALPVTHPTGASSFIDAAIHQALTVVPAREGDGRASPDGAEDTLRRPTGRARRATGVIGVDTKEAAPVRLRKVRPAMGGYGASPASSTVVEPAPRPRHRVAIRAVKGSCHLAPPIVAPPARLAAIVAGHPTKGTSRGGGIA